MLKMDTQIGPMRGGSLYVRRTLMPRLKDGNRSKGASNRLPSFYVTSFFRYLPAPLLYNSHNFRQNAKNVFGQIASLNMFCMHKSRPPKMRGLQKVGLPSEGSTPSA
jgi:hypothetical protein